MQSFTYIVTDPEGFHARPVGMLVKKVKESSCTVRVQKDEKVVDARKMFALMRLGIKCGETITITVEGESEAAAAQELEAFMRENL